MRTESCNAGFWGIVRTYIKLKQTYIIETDLLQSYFTSSLSLQYFYPHLFDEALILTSFSLEI